MRALFLALAAPLAAIAIPTAPVQAQFPADGGPSAGAGGPVAAHRGDGDGHHRRPPVTIVFGAPWGAPPGWALYNNRGWEPDSFNDWWHERPWRAYPRWVQNNRNCERLWWGGGVWRCGW